jgi:Do/DeqQ family serine protease
MNRSQLPYQSIVFVVLLVMFSHQSLWAEDLVSRESAIVKAVRRVSPAVVNISTSKVVERGVNPFFSWEHNEFFDRFFKDFFEPRTRQYVHNSLGSGVIIGGSRKYVLTNHHVIVRASKICVTLSDQREFDAMVVGTDPESDLAILKLETDIELPALPMGRSNDLMIGETVIAIGNPFGLSHSVTTGVISALNRSVRTEHQVFHNFIQIDAPINPGNSGGPLLNINGELIGINTAIYSGAEGIGFAIPIDRAKRIVDNLIHYGKVHTAWLGITVQELTENLIDYFRLPVSNGALITEIVKDSPAEASSLRRGDVIMELCEKKIASPRDYYDQLSQHTANETIELLVYRDGKYHSIEITASSFPSERALTFAFDRLGFKVEELNRNLAKKYGLREGKVLIVSEINRGSQAERIGLRQGDIVRGINEVRLTSKEDFKEAIIKYRLKEKITVLIQRGWTVYSVPFAM